MYYNGPIQPLPNGTEQYYMYCANIATGQVLWQVPLYPAPGAGTPGASITCGQILDWRTQQMHSALPYIWQITSGQYRMYSAVDGELQAQWQNLPAGAAVCNATTVPAVFGGVVYVPGIATTAVSVLTGTLVLEQPNPTIVGQDIGGGIGGGALLEYISGRNTGQNTGWLACWNSTLAIDSISNDPVDWPPGDSQGSFNAGIGTGTSSYIPTIALQQTTMPLDWNWGIMWNLTVPLTSLGNAAVGQGGIGGSSLTSWSIAGADGQYVILQTSKSNPTETGTSYRTLAAIEVDNLPVTTTYTQDVGSDVQHNTPATFAWIENYTVPAYDETYTGSAILEQGGNVLIPDNSVEKPRTG